MAEIWVMITLFFIEFIQNFVYYKAWSFGIRQLQ